MRATATTVLIWCFLLFVAGESLYLHFKTAEKARRWEENYIAAKEEAEHFKTRNKQKAVRITSQEMTIKELRRVNPEIISQLRNLYIPPRLAQTYTQSTATMQAEVTATLKDTVIVRPDSVNRKEDPQPEKIKVLQYRDKWVSVYGVLDSNEPKLKITATDTVFVATYKGERRRPGLWIFSKRKIQVAATNKSPYININVIQSGTIKE